jgi:hypothetical protein
MTIIMNNITAEITKIPFQNNKSKYIPVSDIFISNKVMHNRNNFNLKVIQYPIMYIIMLIFVCYILK